MFFFRKKPPVSSFYVWLTSAVILGLKSLWIFLMPMRGLATTTWLIDDTFIEMKVAENLGHGLGFSLDGIHATTGAPFFWIYLTSLNHIFFGPDLAIRMTFFESAVLGLLAAVLVFHIALKVTDDRRIAWTAFLLSALTANAFLNALNGMDTALFTLLVILSVACYLGVGKPKTWTGFQWGCVTGLVLGLTLMTRGDGIFIAFALGCAKLYEIYKAPLWEKKEHMRTLVGIVLVSAVCFAFFMTWQLLQTGSPLPGNQVGRRGLALAWHNFSYDHFSLPQYLQIVIWNIFQLDELLTIATGSSIFMLAALVSGTLQKKLRVLGIVTVIYLGIFFALLVGYQWYFANLHGLRYINPGAHLLFIFAAALLWQLPVQRWKSAAAVFLTASLIVLAGYKHYQMTSRLPWAPYMSYIGTPNPEKSGIFWGTIDWIRDNLPPDTIVGVRDYGRISMFGDVRIQDLAGNIDPKVAEALNDGTLKDYLKELNVEYLYIPSLEMRTDVLYQYLHKNLRLEQVKGAPVAPTQILYKIIW